MPRQPSAEIALRNLEIYERWRAGESLKQLADCYGRSPQMIGRIVAAHHPDLEDDTDRSLHRGRLDDLYQEVRDVIAHPGYMMSPTGKPAYGPDGEPIANLGLKVEAIRVAQAVLESQRRLDGRDAPQRRHLQIEHSLAEQQATADIAKRRAEKEAEDRRRAAEIARLEGLRVIRGEIEPPPAVAEG
jgi:hypothetical protein